MRSFIRIKVIRGTEYLYKITPYYDPVGKRVRQKSTYLGKNISGTPVRVRNQLPLHVYSCGELLPFVNQINALGIRNVLAQYLEPQEVAATIAIILNRAIHPLALPHISAWYEGTCLHLNGGPLDLSFQSVRTLFQKIGQSVLSERLGWHMLNLLGTRRILLFNISSVRTSSARLVSDEYGLNGNVYSLIPMKLSLVVDRDMGIPVMYHVHPDLMDVGALTDIAKPLTHKGVTDSLLALDCDFFSKDVLRKLSGQGVSFAVHACYSAETVDAVMGSLQSLPSDIALEKTRFGEPLVVNKVQMRSGSNLLQGYCYRFPQREAEEKERLFLRLNEIKRAIESMSQVREDKSRIEHIIGGYKAFIDVRYDRKGNKVSLNEDALSKHIEKMGRFIILHNGEIGWDECLGIYGLRTEFIDKCFDMYRNELYVSNAGVAQDAFKQGFLFTCFVALIAKMSLTKMIRDCGLSDRFSLSDVVAELSSLKLIELTNGKTMTTEQTKKHKIILDQLGLSTDDMGIS